MNPLLFSTVCGFPEQQHYSATTRAFTGFIDASKSYSHSEGCDSVSETNLPTRESDLWDQEHISGSQPHRQLVGAFVEHVVAGLQDGSYALESVLDGVGGSFFVIGTRNKHIAIFKPSTYEVGMQNNPKGHVEEDKAGFLPGKGYLREVAAYALDHQGFARVPVTAVATIFNEIGSLQRFVPHDGDGSYGSKRFITEDIHRIGILDLRLLNCDRHEGNLLYKQVESAACTLRHVFPIDHGYCLPMDDGLQHLEFDWLYYAQAQIPFSSETLLYIDTLNPGEDASVLRNMGFSRGEIELMMAACFALKYGALKKKLTLRYLGDFFRRTQITQPSGFECVVAHCRRGLSIPDNNGNRDVTFINWSEFHPELMSHLDAYSEKVRDCSFGDGTWNHESGASFAVHI